MPIFDVEQGGRSFEIDAPDLTTATAALQQHLGGQSAAPAQPPAPSLGVGGTALDVLKSAGAGLGEGVTGLIGLPGALASLGGQASDWAFGTNLGPGGQRINEAIGPGAVQGAVERATGKFYEPKSGIGGVARTAASFLPALVGGPETLALKLATRVAAPALASEAAGALTQGTPIEPAARAVGALAGGLAPSALRRAATPFPVAAERATALQTLRSEGVQVPASMALGSRALKAAELEMGGGAYTGALERMQEQYTAATLRRAGINETRATPDVLNAAADRIGQQFNSVAARNPSIPVGNFSQQAANIADDFRNITGTEPRLIEQLASRIGPTVSGETYQAVQSEIQRNARKAMSNPELRGALYDLKGALDKAVEAGLKNPADAAAWKAARKDWKNLLVIERAVSGTQEAAAGGIITPVKLTQAIEAIGKRGTYAKGKGDFADLARAGNQIIKPLQDSGTPARLFAKGIPALIGGVLGGGIHPLGVAGALAAGPVAGRVLMSSPVQRYLANQRFRAPAGTVRQRLERAGAIGAPAFVQGQRP